MHTEAPRLAANPRPPADSRRLLAASVLTLSAGLLAATIVITTRPDEPLKYGWWITAGLGVAVAALHFMPRRTLVVSSNLETVNLDEVLFVPMLVIVVPWQSIVVASFASLAGSVLVRRSPLRIAFNLGQMLLATSAGIAVVALLGVRPTTTPGILDVLAGMAGALTLTATTALAVRCMVALATGARLLSLLRELTDRLMPWTGAVMLGGLGTIAIGTHPFAAVLAAGVVIFVHRAYAASFREVAARRHAERLQKTVISLRAHTDPNEIERDLKAAAEDLLGAASSNIVTAGEIGAADSLAAPLDAHRQLLVDERRGPGTWTDHERATLVTLAGVAGDVLRSAEMIARLRTITDSQSEAIIALDLNCDITFANPAARSMLGIDGADDNVGGPIDNRMSLHSRRRPIALAGMVARRIANREADATLIVADRPQLDVAYSITPLYADAAHVGAVLVLRDVSERRVLQDEMARRALHDELTGLPNRRLLLDRIDRALARSRRTGTKHGLIFFDLDRFKLVNDSYGHAVGDKLLLQVAARLRSNLSAADSLARLSGDEFVVLIEDVNTINNVVAVADRLLDVLRQPYELDGHRVYMSASMGVVLTEAGQDRTQVLAAADAAAYAAKAAGRDCYRVSTNDSVEIARTRLDLETRLRHGLDHHEFQVHFQPIVRMAAGEVVGVEALVRWDAPGRGMVVPSDFIPLAEETGLIVPLGRWVLEEACRTTQAWTLRYPERVPLSVSVNLSGVQFSQQLLVDEVASTLERTGLAATQLCLEITETVLMSDTAATVATLEALRDLGVRVAIDDFGTGYSALSYLRRFPIDVVKLDRSFISGLEIDHVDTEIVAAVVRLSTVLGISTVAEGVETDAQRAVLEEMGCPLMQGYLAARPLTADVFEDYWSQRNSQVGPGQLVRMPAPPRAPVAADPLAGPATDERVLGPGDVPEPDAQSASGTAITAEPSTGAQSSPTAGPDRPAPLDKTAQMDGIAEMDRNPGAELRRRDDRRS